MQSLLLSLLPSVLVLHLCIQNDVLASPISIPRPPPGSKVVIVVGGNGNDGMSSAQPLQPPPSSSLFPMMASESQVNDMKSMGLFPTQGQIKRQGHLNIKPTFANSEEQLNNKEKSRLSKLIPSSSRHISDGPSNIFHHHRKNFPTGKMLTSEKRIGPQIVDFRPHQPDITSVMQNNKLTLPVGFANENNNGINSLLGAPSPTPMANKLNPYTNGVAASFPPGIDPYEGFIRYAAENLDTPMGNIIDYHSLEHYYGPQHPLSPYQNNKDANALQSHPYADSFSYNNNGLETGNSPPPPPPPGPPGGFEDGPGPNIGDSGRGRGFEGERGGGFESGRGGGFESGRGGGFESGRDGGFERGRDGGFENERGEGFENERGGGFESERGGGFRTRDNPLDRGHGRPRDNHPNSIAGQYRPFHAPSPGLGSAPPRPHGNSDPALYEEEHEHRSPPFDSPPPDRPPYTQNHRAPPSSAGFNSPSSPPNEHGHNPDPPDLDVFEEGPPPPGSHPPLPDPIPEGENNDGGDDAIHSILDIAHMIERGELPVQGGGNAAATSPDGKPKASQQGGRVVLPIFKGHPPPEEFGNDAPHDGSSSDDSDAAPPHIPPMPPQHSNSGKGGFPGGFGEADAGHGASEGGFDYDEAPEGGNNRPGYGGPLESQESNDYGDDAYNK